MDERALGILTTEIADLMQSMRKISENVALSSRAIGNLTAEMAMQGELISLLLAIVFVNRYEGKAIEAISAMESSLVLSDGDAVLLDNMATVFSNAKTMANRLRLHND